MGVQFQIEHVFDKADRHGPHIIARMLTNNGNFKLTNSLTLGGYSVKKFGMPRVLDDNKNPRFDTFTFDLKNKSEVIYFKRGQIVSLIE
jgi:hypothetical protein